MTIPLMLVIAIVYLIGVIFTFRFLKRKVQVETKTVGATDTDWTDTVTFLAAINIPGLIFNAIGLILKAVIFLL